MYICIDIYIHIYILNLRRSPLIIGTSFRNDRWFGFRPLIIDAAPAPPAAF